MSINFSQFHHVEQSLDTHAALEGNFVKNSRQCYHLNRFVIRNSHGMSQGRLTAQDHVTTCLSFEDISYPSESTQQLIARQIARQLYAASSIRSSSKCRRILPGFNVASAKWQLTASRTMVSSSSQESPCVVIKPSGRRQFAVKPPSSAGRTLKTSSRSFML